MFRTLIVPLDGSDQAERALPYAVRLARAGGGSLVLVRATMGPPPSGQDWEHQQLLAVEESTAYLAAVASKISTRVSVSTFEPYGHAADQILASVERFGADGIIMSTRGRTGLAHIVAGSVAETVLARATVPVLLVHARPGEAAAAPFDPPSARILVPLDGSALSETAVPVASAMFGVAGEIVLLTVIELPDHVVQDESGRTIAYIDQQEAGRRQEALDYLRGHARQLTSDNPDLHVTCDVRIGAPAEGIILAEVERSADLVVMATHGRTGVQRALTGSVAGAVVRDGHAPVLLVPPHAFISRAPVETRGVLGSCVPS
jgi:nucleotide-binding universal stress UspA family protein